MMRVPRLIVLLTLLAALVVAGIVPATGSWSCPDGTACVYTAGRGFHCLGDRCRMPCCMAKRSGRTTATRRSPRGRCDHGTTPGCPLSGRIASGSHDRTVDEPAQCRFHENGQAPAAWMPVRT